MEEPPPRQAVLPITIATGTPTIHPKSKKLKLLPLIFLIYFEVAGGPFGEEPAVKAGGPLLAILGFLVFPFIWSVPEALITAELSTTYPGNGGFVIWADKAFGPFWGSLMGTWKFLSVVINIAAFPSLCLSYMQMVFPVLASGWPRQVALCGSTVVLSLVNFTGLVIVGNIAIVLAIVSLTPFVIMSCMAIPNIKPHRWLSLGQTGVEKDWKLFFNTLFWNLNFWDSVSTLAGEVEKPHKTFPKALFVAVIFTCFTYLFPLFAVTGSLELDQKSWDTGFYANAAGIIGGKWLKYFLEIGAVIGAIGLYEAQLSSSSFQILGMAEIGVLPKFCGVRHKKFDTPWVGILISTMIVLGVSFMDFTNIISSANFLYSLSMLLEFASFIWLRKKQPTLKRPYRVPIKLPGLVIMCLIPSAFLIYVMALGTPIVYIVSAIMTAGGIGWYFLMKVCKSKKWFKFNANEIQDIEE